MTNEDKMVGFVPAKVWKTNYPYLDHNLCESVLFGREDVKAFGLLCAWGDNVNRYMVTLQDDRQLILVGGGQSKDNLKWLRKLAKQVVGRNCSRDLGWTIHWTVL